MADAKISALTDGSPAVAADELAVSRTAGSATRRVTAQSIADLRVIANNEVTLAKMADIATASILGRTTAATGDPEVLTAAQVISLLGAVTVLDREVTQINVTGSTETSIFSHTIPAGLLSTNRAVRLTINGDFITTGATSPTLTVRMKLGGTTIFADATAALTVSSTRRVFNMNFLLGQQNAANAQRMNGYIVQAANAAATTGLGDLGAAGTAYSFGSDSTIDMAAADRVLEVTIQWGGTVGSASYLRQYAVLELL